VPIKLILTGGSGLIGSALQQKLAHLHIECINLVRNGTKFAEPSVPWEPKNPSKPISETDRIRLLEGCDYVVHLAGANLSTRRWTPAYKKTILDSRVDSSLALVNLLSCLKQPPRVLVCASATGIYGDRGDEILTEDAGPGAGFLPEVCRAWEQTPEGARALGIRLVHMRFGVMLSPHGGALQKMLPAFKAGLGAQLGDGRQWMSWIALDDVVSAVLFALENDSASGAYNTVAPHPVTNREFTKALATAVHRPAPWIVPGFALKLLFGQMAQDALLASSRALPARLEAAGFRFQFPDLQPALESVLRKR
jgi:uncharacterized protein